MENGVAEDGVAAEESIDVSRMSKIARICLGEEGNEDEITAIKRECLEILKEFEKLNNISEELENKDDAQAGETGTCVAVSEIASGRETVEFDKELLVEQFWKRDEKGNLIVPKLL